MTLYLNLEQNVAEIKSFENIIDELKQIYPSAVVRGESILHSAGWITQISQRINIAVLESRTYVSDLPYRLKTRIGIKKLMTTC
jgi:hypothetical protein